MNNDRYRDQLQKERERLLMEIEKNSKPQDFGDDVDSMDEEADEGESMANRLALAQSLRERVNEIEDALHRITAGTYGTCSKCGKPIPAEVLDLAPESDLCTDCKKEASV